MKKLHIILVLLLLALVDPAYCQKTKGKSKKQLQSEITSLQKEISTANQLLKKTTKDKEMTLNEVNLLDKKIKQREKLIKAYNEQIAVLDEEISQGQSNIKTLNTDLGKLQKEYAKMITFAYKNRSHYDRLAFIFAADDFNQAFSRLRYIRQFSDARKVKMEQISSTQRQISNAVEASQQAREEQTALLKDEKTQQDALKGEKAKKITFLTGFKYPLFILSSVLRYLFLLNFAADFDEQEKNAMSRNSIANQINKNIIIH